MSYNYRNNQDCYNWFLNYSQNYNQNYRPGGYPGYPVYTDPYHSMSNDESMEKKDNVPAKESVARDEGMSNNVRYNRIEPPTMDFGPNPFAIDIEDAAEDNNNFRQALWTGEYLQVTLMSIGVNEEIGLEVHNDHDQFIRIEEGDGMIVMGDSRDNLDFQVSVDEDYAIMIPAGKWHNLINTGRSPLKLFSVYAPPEHPKGTVQPRRENTTT